MFSGKDPEVLVVGAGPVGLFAALALAKKGVEVRIVDRGVWPCAQSYALALHPQSLGLLKEYGLLEAVLDKSRQIRTISVSDAAGHRADVRLGDEASSCLAVVRQDALESLLERRLEEAGVQVEWRHEVPRLIPGPDHVDATIDKFEKESRGYIVAHTEWTIAKSMDLQTPFVIGADGYSSRVRRALKIDFPEVAAPEYYAVFEFKTDAKFGDEMRVMVGNGATDVLWPLPDGHCRWSFQLPAYRDVEADKRKAAMESAGFDIPSLRTKERMASYGSTMTDQLDEASLWALIGERAPWFTGNIDNLVWHSVIRFERRLATSFGNGRLWLAGDAAHLTGPIGVQSMNAGLHEASELAGLMAGVLRNQAPIQSLDAYGQRWGAVWDHLHGIDTTVKAVDGANSWIAPHAKRLLSCLPAVGAELAPLAAQLGLVVETASAAGV